MGSNQEVSGGYGADAGHQIPTATVVVVWACAGSNRGPPTGLPNSQLTSRDDG